MTGKELIIYILQNNLENEDVFKNGIFVGFMSIGEAAVKFDVGYHTIKFWYEAGMIDGIEIGGALYFKKDLTDPRKETV